MNRKLGITASIAACTCTVLFAIALLINQDNMSYFVCLFLSWAYVLTTCASASYAPPARKGMALGGVAVAGLYSALITLVYFTQLTAVAPETAPPALLNSLRMVPGTWLFALDMLGYGLMG